MQSRNSKDGQSTADIRAAFKKRISENRLILAPGIYDALSARIAEALEFEAVFLSGSAISFSQLARPDIGLVTMTELVETADRVSDRVSVPILADIDSAFGAAAHAARLMRSFERAGVAAVQMEDQEVVKPNATPLARPLVSIEEMTGKIKAMTDARHSEDTLISARTDSKDPNDAIERCVAFKEAGADLVFAEGINDAEVISRLIRAVGEETPVLFNTMHLAGIGDDVSALEELGVRIALAPALAVQNAAHSMMTALKNLQANPSLDQGLKSPMPAPALMDLLEAEAFLDKMGTY